LERLIGQFRSFLCILEPAISTDGPMGKMVLTVLGMVAEMELGFIKAR
jgi:DNA invertase Pin-like site-specific DNA recombinase